MRIELTELLRCPRCSSRAGLVAFIERSERGRVLEGDLGCPFCETRYPVRAGEADLTSGGEPAPEPDAGAPEAAGLPADRVARSERALALAALLGLQEQTRGYVLLDQALCPLAERLARLAPGRGIVALVPQLRTPSEPGSADCSEPGPADPSQPGSADSPGAGGAAASRVLVDVGAALPVLPGRLAGVALLDPDRQRLEDATRALGPGGRLVVLEPGAEVPVTLEEIGLRVLAADDTALVAVPDVGQS